MAKTAVGQAVTAVSLPRAAVGATSNIVVNTPAGVGSNFAAINRRMSQASAGQPATVVRCFLFLTTLYNSRIQIQSYLCHIQILFISNILGAIAVVIIW